MWKSWFTSVKIGITQLLIRRYCNLRRCIRVVLTNVPVIDIYRDLEYIKVREPTKFRSIYIDAGVNYCLHQSNMWRKFIQMESELNKFCYANESESAREQKCSSDNLEAKLNNLQISYNR